MKSEPVTLAFNPAHFEPVAAQSTQPGYRSGTVTSDRQTVYHELGEGRWLRAELVKDGDQARIVRADVCASRDAKGWQSVQPYQGRLELASDPHAAKSAMPEYTPSEAAGVVHRLYARPRSKSR